MIETESILGYQQTSIAIPSWLIIPSIQPEELAEGFVARLRIVNGFTSAKDFFNALKEWNPELESIPKVQILAMLCGLPLKDFVCRFTLTPFKRAFGLVGKRFHPHGEDIGGHLKYGTMGVPTGKVSACPDCVWEDINYWGFAYWRRIHQVSGVGWCPKHQTKLVVDDKSALNTFPDQIINLTLTTTQDTNSRPPAIVQRYTDIVDHALDRKAPINVRILQQVVRSEARKCGLRISRRGNKPLLSDLAVSECPNEWLMELIPDFHKKKFGHPLAALDAATRGGAGPSQEASILALALLFPSSDAALQKINDVEYSAPEKARRVVSKYPRDFWLGAELTEIYIKQKGSVSRIAKELGLSYSHTLTCLQKVGLPMLRARKLQLIKPAVTDFLQGDDLTTVCSRYEIELHLIEQILRQDLFRVRDIFLS